MLSSAGISKQVIRVAKLLNSYLQCLLLLQMRYTKCKSLFSHFDMFVCVYIFVHNLLIRCWCKSLRSCRRCGESGLSYKAFANGCRWDDDVVFKNQARGELKPAKRFINDTIRNDFHRKFLNKYMK